jgi:hypothetical protein
MKYHFITFATIDYINHANNICDTAIKLGGFDIVKIFTPNDLDEVYFNKNKDILNQKQGAGFWIWKSYIILKYLYEINKDDIICYCDTLYLFTGETKIQQIVQNIIHDSGIFITHNKPNEPVYMENEYSKGDAFYLMNALNPNYNKTPQAWGGFIIIRNNFIALQVISEWFTYVQDERIVTNLPCSINKNDDIFIENRHDQTVISIIAKKYNIPFYNFPKKFLYNIRIGPEKCE